MSTAWDRRRSDGTFNTSNTHLGYLVIIFRAAASVMFRERGLQIVYDGHAGLVQAKIAGGI